MIKYLLIVLLLSAPITVKADFQLYVFDLDKYYENDGTYQVIHTERFISYSDCNKQGKKFRDFAGYFGGRAGWHCPFI